MSYYLIIDLSRVLYLVHANRLEAAFISRQASPSGSICLLSVCREDHVNELHFDTRQFNCLLWTDNGRVELTRRLQMRIEAVVGRGPIEAYPRASEG